MTILQILQMILGMLFTLFIPGFLVVKTFFDELDTLQKILFSMLISMMIDVAIAIWLGYDAAQKARTGGMSVYSVWDYAITVSAILGVVYLIRWFTHKRKVEHERDAQEE